MIKLKKINKNFLSYNYLFLVEKYIEQVFHITVFKTKTYPCLSGKTIKFCQESRQVLQQFETSQQKVSF